MLFGGFHSISKIGEIQLKSLFPGCDRRLDLPEVIVVALLPETPGRRQEDIHPHLSGLHGFLVHDHIESVMMCGPGETQRSLALLTESAIKY